MHAAGGLERAHVYLDPGPVAHIGEALAHTHLTKGSRRRTGRRATTYQSPDRRPERRDRHSPRASSCRARARCAPRSRGPSRTHRPSCRTANTGRTFCHPGCIEVTRQLRRERHLRHPSELVADALVVELGASTLHRVSTCLSQR